MTDEARPPELRIVRGGKPTAEEIAALVAALGVLNTSDGENSRGASGRSRWSARAETLRRPLNPGPGAWRVSAR